MIVPSTSPRTTSFPARLALALLLAATAAASGRAAQFASGVSLVEVYATVTGADGPVTDLTQSDFTVSENGVVQRISTFAAGDFPLSVAIALDHSASMTGERLTLAKAAARRFLETLRPADRAMVVAVANTVDVVAPLSADRAAAIRAVQALEPWSTTSLHDAIIASIDMIQPAGGRRALVLLSDGASRYSQATAAEALERARTADVLVYPVAIGGARPPLFAGLAVLTGGRSFEVRRLDRLDTTLDSIARELRFQYLLGYTPSRPMNPGEPEWRSIGVKVSRPGLQVRARNGYVAK